MDKMDNNKPTTIDIARSRRSRSFEKEERLWGKDLERLARMIERHIENLKRFNNDQKGGSAYDSAPNVSLAIFGPAGSGKSSLLKTLVHEAKNPNKEEDSRLFKKPGVASLNILQPARFGPGDHLLYATIAASLKAHREEQGEDLEYEVLTPVLKQYRKLADHLRVIRAEKIPDDLEPHALAAEVIQRHTSGLELSGHLDDFFDILANDLNPDLKGSSSVVLLPVDDLDLMPEHLPQGLRELQAYLLHPRLIPVFCFTDRLAEEILAGQFANIVQHADSERKNRGRSNVSEQLAVQYLSKCFPIRNRLRLGPLPANLQAGRLRTYKDTDSDSSERILLTLTAASVLLYGVPDRTARHLVPSALRPSTLRRQFHILDAVRQAINNQINTEGIRKLLNLSPESSDSTKCGKKENVADEPGRLREPWGQLFDRAVWALMNVHRDVLREYGLHLEDLYSWSPHALRRVLLDKLFQLPGEEQVGLWQRWRSLTDSRRSQVISLLAANVHRPWLEGEQPSGEDYSQFTEAEALLTLPNASDREKQDNCLADKGYNVIPSPIALLWFLDIVTGFYLPLNRSVYRQLRSEQTHSHSPSREPLGGAGWSFHTAPIQAALAADDDRKLFPTGMMFLDPFSYAAALTTVPRVAACRVLDSITPADDEQWEVVKRAKIKVLSIPTDKAIETEDELALKEELCKLAEDGLANTNISSRKFSVHLEEAFEEAAREYAEAATWEAGKKWNNATLTGDARQGWENTDLHDLLIDRKFKEALKSKNLSDSDRKLISGLATAADAVHDDQLLLRTWTCYGYNRGRFWAAVSLWRGLGLIGQLIENYRSHRTKILSRLQLNRDTRSDKEAVRRVLDNHPKYEPESVASITGILRTHSLRGLVPGKDLGEPMHKGSLELAFPGWNTREQREAIRRLAERLHSWLHHSWDIETHPLQSSHGPEDQPRWSHCFIRRLHGGAIVGALWQWLDAEHLEHQGGQYGERRSYYWNAGVALTSWIRVLQRYFNRSYEPRWLIETCPLTSPFLSRTQRDPLLSKLFEQPYGHILQKFVARYGELSVDNASKKTCTIRLAERFREVTLALQQIWMEDHRLPALKAQKVLGESFFETLPDPDRSLTRGEWEKILSAVLVSLVPEDPESLADHSTNASSTEIFPVMDRIAAQAREAIWASDDQEDNAREREKKYKNRLNEYRQSLLDSFDPRVDSTHREMLGEAADGDIIDTRSACFEIASIIQQHWKVTAHASAASLFYQIPRVHREDFFGHRETHKQETEIRFGSPLKVDGVNTTCDQSVEPQAEEKGSPDTNHDPGTK